MLSDNIFSSFIENDNHRIITSLKKIKKIYTKYLRKKILYYFLKYYHNAIKMKITNDINDIDINSSIPFALSDIDPLDSCNFIKNNIPLTNVNNTHYKNNSSVIEYSLISENNNPLNGNNTDRINRRNILDKKNVRRKRNLSYGNLHVRMNKDIDNFNTVDNHNNSRRINNSYFINNNNTTQSLKHIFPNYTFTTPNKYIYPIILNNNNNGMNNSYFYPYSGNTIVYQNDIKSEQSKPLLWYTNVFPSISQISIMQDNNYLNRFQYQTPRYINNSSYFNSISNINNSYSEDYLNKQIFDFINANSETKKNIISNIGKKHNIKLSKSKKVNTKDVKNKEKSEKNKKDKNFSKNRNRQIVLDKIKNKNFSEYHELHSENIQKNEIVINKYKRNQKIKTGKNSIPIGQKKNNDINNIKIKNIDLDKNKIIKNYSIEISNSVQFINNSDYLCENNKSQYETNPNKINYQFNKNNQISVYNSQEKEEDEQNNSFNESLGTSLQSMNDSRMFELANHFIDEDKTVNKDKVNAILKEKYSQINIKMNK